MNTEAFPNITTAATGTEQKQLREWLANPPERSPLITDLRTLRALIAMGCTLRKWDPGTAGRRLLTWEEVGALITEAAQYHDQILGQKKLPEHFAPIIPAKGMLFAMVIQKPSGAQINEIQNRVFGASIDREQAQALRTSMLEQMLTSCTLFPDVQTRQAVFIEYAGLALEFAAACQRLASEAAEEVVGK